MRSRFRNALKIVEAPRVVRIWDQARTFHLELLSSLAPSELLYRTKNYSFSEELAAGANAKQVGVLRTLWMIAFGKHDVVELNEPTMFKIWPILLAYTSMHRIRRLFDRNAPKAVVYAIDNLSLVDSMSATFHISPRLVRYVLAPFFRYLFSTFDRVAFGSAGAKTAYLDMLGDFPRRTETEVIVQISNPCSCVVVPQRRGHVVFVGSLEPRKGVLELMRSWETVERMDGNATLTLVGKGELEGAVRDWASGRDRVSVLIDPPRPVIHRTYREAELVVLLSQRVSRWREQIGLPILEGLGHGCRIITTDESGISQWLEEHGHVVLGGGAADSDVAGAITEILRESRSSDSVLADLPIAHGRVAADRWLTR